MRRERLDAMVLHILEGQGGSQDEGLSIFWQNVAGVCENAGTSILSLVEGARRVSAVGALCREFMSKMENDPRIEWVLKRM